VGTSRTLQLQQFVKVCLRTQAIQQYIVTQQRICNTKCDSS